LWHRRGKNAYKILMDKPEGKRATLKAYFRWEDVNRMDII
jgi:hypothetical protein